MDDHQADAANNPSGVPRVNDRRVLNGIFWLLRSGHGATCRWLRSVHHLLQPLHSLATGWCLGPDHGRAGCSCSDCDAGTESER